MNETRSMSPVLRRVLWIVGGALALLLVLVLALPYVVSLDAMRARVVAAAESSLKRKVEIGRMRLQILSGPGAGVEKVTVRNGPGWETPALLTADRVSVKVAFWPLLARRVEVRKLVLDGVTIAIERNPEGVLNVKDFLSAGARESTPASRTAATALMVSRIEIDRGRVAFVDRKVSPGQTVTLALEDLTGRIADIGPSTPARFELAGRFLADSGRNLTLSGTLGPPPPPGKPVREAPVRAAFAAKSLALGRLAPYVAAFREDEPGTFTLDGRADGTLLGVATIAGNVALDPAAATSPIPSLDGTFALALDFPKGTLVVQRSLLDVGGLPLAVEGRVDDLAKTPRVDLRIATPGEVTLEDVTGLPGVAGRLPENVRLAGKLELEARIQGPTSDLDSTATVDASPFDVAVGGQPFLSAPAARATLAARGDAPMAGRVTIPSGKLQNLAFEELVADWTWADGAVTLVPSARVFGGTLGARVETHVRKPGAESRATLEVKAVPAQALVESLTSLRDVFAGTLSGSIALTSRGLAWDAIRKTARGEGRLSVANADLRTVKLMPEVARCLQAVAQVAGFTVPAGLESTKFTAMKTSLRLADGRLETPDLTLYGPDVAVAADGFLGLDRTLAYSGRIVLGPAVVKSFGTAGRYLADSQGRLALPFTVRGAITSPKVAIDESIVLDLGRRVLARQAGEKIGGTAGKVIGDVLDSGGGEGRTGGALDALQRLLEAPARTPTPTPK